MHESKAAFGSSVLQLVLVLAVFVGVGGGSAQTPSDDAVRFGVILPPVASNRAEVGATGWDVPARAALQGATMARDEFGHNAELLGLELDVRIRHAEDVQAVRMEAERLLAEQDVGALVGGFGQARAQALSEVAAEHGVPFLNIGSSAGILRHEQCQRTTFHVVPSDAMYLDALVGFFVRSGFRRWAFVTEGSERGAELEERASWAIEHRHFGARSVASVAVSDDGADWSGVLDALADGDPDVILMLVDPAQQLALLEAAEGHELEAQLTGFPFAPSQTREFYDAARRRAPTRGIGFWSNGWEATLDSYGARELNARYLDRFGEPMNASAWAAYVAVKLVYEAATFGQSANAESLIAQLTKQDAAFDVWKGIGVTFRPWDHQLRQSLFLVQVRPEVEDAFDMVYLVGELPALYLPRTDPVERLDQLGDLEARSRCTL